MHVAIHNNDVCDRLPITSSAVCLFRVMIWTDNPLTVTAEVAFLEYQFLALVQGFYKAFVRLLTLLFLLVDSVVE